MRKALMLVWLSVSCLLCEHIFGAEPQGGVINDFEAQDLTGVWAYHRGKQHPSKVELNTDPEFVKHGKQSLRFALDMTHKGTYSYCMLWFPVPKRPTKDTPAVSLWVKGKKGALIGNFTFYIGGSPKFRSEKFRFMAGDWRRVVISHWNRLTGATPADWTNVRRFSFIATNGNDAELYFDDIRFISKAEADMLAPSTEAAGTKSPPAGRSSKLIRCAPLYGMQRLVFYVPEECPLASGGLQQLQVAATITPKGRAAPMRVETLSGFSLRQRRKTADISGLTPGDYTLTYLIQRGGQQLESHELNLHVPRPEPWWNQHIGISGLDPDHVPPPWRPIEARGAVVSVWNRDYALGAMGLPKQIEVAGKPILAGPVEVAVQSEGARLVARGEPVLVAAHEGVCRFGGEDVSGNVNVKAQTRIEYDGLMSVELELAPRGRQRIDAATLTVPLQAEYAVAFHYQPYLPTGGIIPYGGVRIPSIFKERPGSGRIPAGQGVVWRRPYSPLLWVGSHSRGLCFFVESEEGFYPQGLKDRGTRTAIRRDGNRVALVIRLVSKPVATAKPLRFRFGFMATPVKPMPAGWRGWRVTTRRTNIPKAIYPAGTGNMHVFWQRFTRKYGVLDPNLARPDAFARAAAADHAAGRAVMPYYAPQWIVAGVYDPIAEKWLNKNPAFDTYFPEWRADPYETIDYPTHPPKVTRTYSGSISDNAWSDYLLWLMREQARRGADGYYSDCCGPTPDSNPVYGCGYLGRDGRRRPTFNLDPTRNLLKRALAMYRQVRGKGRRLTGLGIMHGTGVSPVLVPFFDARLDGEFERTNLTNLVRRDKSVAPYFYGRLYDLEGFRIQYAGEKFGIPMIFLPELEWVSHTTNLLDKKTMLSPAATRDFLVMTLLTDTLVWPIWCNHEEVYKTWAVKDRFGIGDADVKLIPYWSRQSPVTTNADGVKVTLYRKPGRMLVIVGNTSFDPRAVELRVALKQLGIQSHATFVDGMSGERFTVVNGKMTLSLPARDFRMLLWGA